MLLKTPYMVISLSIGYFLKPQGIALYVHHLLFPGRNVDYILLGIKDCLVAAGAYVLFGEG